MTKWSYNLRLCLAILFTSFFTGLGGILMHELFNFVEWLAYGKTMENFLVWVSYVTPTRRLLAIVVMGIFSAIFWYYLQRKHALVSTKEQSTSEKERKLQPYFWQHILHTFVQIAFVGAGGPVGKEGAPREFGALSAGRIGHRFDLTLQDKHLLIVCGASAGLAAVYQVPLSSFFFAFETFALTLSLRSGVIVLFTTYAAAILANPIVTSHAMYDIPKVTFTVNDFPALIFLALLIAPLGGWFRFLTQKANRYRKKDKTILYFLPLASLITGLFALVFPSILGNGSALIQEAFSGLSFSRAAILFVIKASVILLCFLAGAYGGTLTSSFALGSLSGLLLFDLSHTLLGITHPEFLMLAGAASFLAVTMKAPLTAAGLAIAFTKQNPALLIPILFCVFLTTTLHQFLSKQN
ncbi:chloride channel protein [Streptococcus sciuri]|uniref:Chloride channel protein n=1 Tax=Streptococcus sciuri TaxID=2973939 RepID=A0ABT2F5L4_9STRE|nr:chloride channel protein [Streptococcus sciuri]MCS4487727.1 chloride channel protein [Streptococcus sciuri]